MKMPYFDAKKLSRRAINYLLLGLSLPPILDVNTTPATITLRSLASVLVKSSATAEVQATGLETRLMSLV